MRKIYIPKNYVPRLELQEQFDKFAKSRNERLCIQGIAGTGKTSAMAHLAENTEVALFISGYSITKESKSILDIVHSEIEVSLEQDLLLRGDSLALSISQHFDFPLVIFVDALNEARISPEEMSQNWLPDSLLALREKNIQLVISVRREYWTHVEELLIEKDDKESPHNFVTLANYNDDELDLAFRAYDLVPRFEMDRHPLFLRIRSELARSNKTDLSQDKSNPLNIYDKYISKLIERVSRQTGASTVIVDGWLKRLALEAGKNNDYQVDQETYLNHFVNADNIIQSLVSEGILYEQDKNFRFTFDEIADFLMSYKLDLNSLFQQYLPKGSTFALYRMENAGDLSSVKQVLNYYVDRIAKTENLQASTYFVNFISNTSEPGEYLAQITEFSSLRKNSFLVRDFNQVIKTLSIDTSEKFNLIRLSLLNEYYYPWRPKDRHILFSQSDYLWSDFRDLISHLTIREPQAAFRSLLMWLSDSSLMREGEARIIDIAESFLIHHCKLNMKWLLAQLADIENPSQDLLRGITEQNPELVADLCIDWIHSNKTKYNDLIVKLSRCLALSDTSFSIKILQDLLNTSDSTADTANAIKLLFQLGYHSESLWNKSLTLYKSGDLPIEALYPNAKHHWKEFIPYYSEHMKSEGIFPDSDIFDCVSDEAHLKDLIGTIIKNWEFIAEDVGKVASALERKLYRLSYEQAANSKVFELIDLVLLTNDSSSRRCFIYYAYTFLDDEKIEKQLLSVVQGKIEKYIQESDINLILDQVLGDQNQFDSISTVLNRISSEIDSELFETCLLSLYKSEAIDLLLRWLNTGTYQLTKDIASILNTPLRERVLKKYEK